MKKIIIDVKHKIKLYFILFLGHIANSKLIYEFLDFYKKQNLLKHTNSFNIWQLYIECYLNKILEFSHNQDKKLRLDVLKKRIEVLQSFNA